MSFTDPTPQYQISAGDVTPGMRHPFTFFVECSVIQLFRSSVQTFTDTRLQLDPKVIMFYLSPILRKAYKNSILRHLFSAAKASILLHWKDPQPPAIVQ